ncbi:MAG: hypothetical protein ACREEC_04265, partial [Thermoplasmata archaeon]
MSEPVDHYALKLIHGHARPVGQYIPTLWRRNMTLLYTTLAVLGGQAVIFALVGMALLVRISMRAAPPARRIEDLLPAIARP